MSAPKTYAPGTPEFRGLCLWFNSIDDDAEFAEALEQYPGLVDYDAKGNWIGPVANENGWTP